MEEIINTEVYLRPDHCEDLGAKYFETSDFTARLSVVRGLRRSWDSKHTNFFTYLEDRFGDAIINWRRIDHTDTKHYGFVKPQSPGWFYVWKVNGERP